MNRNQVGVQLKPGLNFPYARKWLHFVIVTCLRLEAVKRPYEINLVVTDNTIIHELNRSYRGIDRPTDVLSFPYSETAIKTDDVVFITPSDNVNHLGEIAISYPYIVRQARVHDSTVEQELMLIIVHGILHLLGYDHESEAGNRKMRLRERSIIQQIMKLLE